MVSLLSEVLQSTCVWYVIGKLFVYNMRNCKEPFDVIEAHDKPIRSLAAQNPIKVINIQL